MLDDDQRIEASSSEGLHASEHRARFDPLEKNHASAWLEERTIDISYRD